MDQVYFKAGSVRAYILNILISNRECKFVIILMHVKTWSIIMQMLGQVDITVRRTLMVGTHHLPPNFLYIVTMYHANCTLISATDFAQKEN